MMMKKFATLVVLFSFTTSTFSSVAVAQNKFAGRPHENQVLEGGGRDPNQNGFQADALSRRFDKEDPENNMRA
jgi:hypothetical protein